MSPINEIETTPLPDTVVEKALAAIPQDVLSMLQELGPRAVVGGGFLRTMGSQVIHWEGRAEKAPKDLDIFTSGADLRLFIRDLHSRRYAGARYYGLDMHGESVSFDARSPGEVPVQIIGMFSFCDPLELMGKFDFSVARAVLWWDGAAWASAAHQCWETDIRMRRAWYCKAPNPIGTLLRIERYVALGYRVAPECVAGIAGQAARQAEEWIAADPSHAGYTIAEAIQALSEEVISPPPCEWCRPTEEPLGCSHGEEARSGAQPSTPAGASDARDRDHTSAKHRGLRHCH